ncbi:MAG TPA: hypothetical protein VEP68_10055 [Anaeromyxobacteraceae bacterium]|nr:hypothetical protein [Anaeromyxobacteraceae bacterium]
MTGLSPRRAGPELRPAAGATGPSRPHPAIALAVALAAASPAPAGPLAADPGTATVVLAARSIGSRRGEPLDRRAHAALLVRLDGRPGGFVVQGGKEPGPGTLFGTRHRVVGWAIPAGDPSAEFARAVGGYWGEPGVREVPVREIARFAVKGLGEARLRQLVDSLNQEFRDRDYRLEGGPSSNSFVSRFLDRLGLPLPSLGDVQLPGWGWRP